jgi:hypothetical protein
MGDKTNEEMVLTLAELATMMFRSEDYIRKNKQKLVENHGFPNELPGFGNRWSRAAIIEWIARSGHPLPSTTGVEDSDDHSV